MPAVASVPKQVETPKVKKPRKQKVVEEQPEEVSEPQQEEPKKVKKTRKPKVVEEVPEQVEEETEDQEVLEEEMEELTTVQRFDELSLWIKDVISDLREMEKEVRALKSTYNREIKELSKKKKVKRAHKGNKDTGFLKPSRISAALSEFLGVPADTLFTRPQVVSAINTYAVEHNLKDENKKSVFNENDPRLRKLFGEPRHLKLKKSPELGNGYSLHNIQTYLKEQGHFIKDE